MIYRNEHMKLFIFEMKKYLPPSNITEGSHWCLLRFFFRDYFDSESETSLKSPVFKCIAVNDGEFDIELH